MTGRAFGHTHGAARADVVALALELGDESPDIAAQRMGMSLAAVARALYRAHRPDLARRYSTRDYQTRHATTRRTAA